jgi:hypothetical protein
MSAGIEQTMQRDMDLARKILLALEAKPDGQAVETLDIEGYDDSAIRYDLLLLAQAKLIDYEPTLTKSGRMICVVAFNPSWEGHEFLDAVRNDAVWSTVKAQASEKGSSLPFDVLKTLALEAVRRLFEF